MAPRKGSKKTAKQKSNPLESGVHIIGAGDVVEQPITETIETNYFPYAMSVIMSRAIPEIDGFKPSHRKILYTMYKMGLLTGSRSKSANIVGRTMQLNPHGDAAIYETMVRLSSGYEALLHPFVDSKGNFGKAYSRDMMWAASRYTEAKLAAISAELFKDIDKDTVDFVDNYDSTMKEPTLLPVTFPTVLVNSNTGIAVGMASSICSFNLEEVCKTTIELIKNPDHCIADTLKAPDFAGGARILYDRAKTEEIYRTGRGSFKLYAKYNYDKANNCIDITEIPMTSTSTCESIIEKVIDRVKAGVIREISDIRDETDRDGLKITIDLKRGADPEKLMQKLYKITPLSDSFSCNFNVLIAGAPKVMGVAELLTQWIKFRTECVRRRTNFDLTKAKEKLHLLEGLQKILVDIDKAIKIVRETDEESEVVPNLMIGFGIDKIQAEFVAEIKLRHLNREYILKRTQDIEELRAKIADLEDILLKKGRIGSIIISELKEVIKKYAQPRKTEIIYEADIPSEDEADEVPNYPVHVFFSKEGYFKKITPQSLRMSNEQKLKDGDEIAQTMLTDNAKEVLFFTNKCQVYKAKLNDFKDTKASVFGDYIPSKLEMDEDEIPIYMVITSDYSGYMMFFFENGKAAKVELSAYQTKTNRKKLVNAYSDKAQLSQIIYSEGDSDLVLISSAGRHLLINTGAIAPKTTKSTQGVAVMSLKKGQTLATVRAYSEGEFKKAYRYKTKNLPAAGMLLSAEDKGDQLTLDI